MLKKENPNNSYAAEARVSPMATGAYGNFFEGLEVTDSLPIPRLMGVFDAMENMTSGALSVRERPFHDRSGHQGYTKICSVRFVILRARAYCSIAVSDLAGFCVTWCVSGNCERSHPPPRASTRATAEVICCT